MCVGVYVCMDVCVPVIITFKYKVEEGISSALFNTIEAFLFGILFCFVFNNVEGRWTFPRTIKNTTSLIAFFSFG